MSPTSEKRPPDEARKRTTVSRAGGRQGTVARTGRKEKGVFFSTSNLRSILWVIVAFLVIRTFLLEAFKIPSGSMEPTLLVNDHLFVNKLAYGPHIPFTNINLPGYREPQRDDLAVYRSPDAGDGHPTVVKRIVALAGDTVHMRGGQLFVNGIAQRRSYGAPENPMHGSLTHPDFLWQRNHAIAGTRFGPPPAQPTYDDWGPLVVPPEHFFGLGDNRHDSKDARNYGPVPRTNLRGRPLFIYYSYESRDTDSPVPFITDIRWRRIGTSIR